MVLRQTAPERDHQSLSGGRGRPAPGRRNHRVHGPEPELARPRSVRRTSPGERRPLAADGIERCRQILEAWSKTRERHPRQHPYRQVTPETLERLRALGYVK